MKYVGQKKRGGSNLHDNRHTPIKYLHYFFVFLVSAASIF